jgi:hypothetical protein
MGADNLMTFPTSRQDDSVEAIARQIDAMVSAAIDRLQSWRAEVASSSLQGYSSREAYQQLISARNYVNSKGSAPGLAEAYKRMFNSLPVEFNPVTEWNASAAAIVSFATWFQANWPQKTAAGHPAFESFAANGEIQQLMLTLTNAQRTSLLAQIDGVLATFD